MPGCAVYILQKIDSVPVLSPERDLRSLMSQEEESGGQGPVGGEFLSTCSGPSGADQEQDIVQRSASEQTH